MLEKIQEEDNRKIKELLALSKDFETESGLDGPIPEDRRPPEGYDTTSITMSKKQNQKEKSKYIDQYNRTVKAA